MRTKLPITPNLILDETPISAEGALVDADRVRERLGKVEAIGGWTQITADTVTGSPRAAHSWADTDGVAWGAVATHAAVEALTGTTLYDITPAVETTGSAYGAFVLSNILSVGSGARQTLTVTTTNGSAVVTVNHTAHGLTTGRKVSIRPVEAGMTLNGVAFDGHYAVTVVNANSYTVTGTTNATSSGGLSDTSACYLDVLLETGTQDASGSTPITAWTLDNFGELLVANRRGGKVHEWAPSTGTEMVQNYDFIDALTPSWTVTNWIRTSTGDGEARNISATPNSLVQTVSGMETGRLYRATLKIIADPGVGGANLLLKNGATTVLTIPSGSAVYQSVVFRASDTAISLSTSTTDVWGVDFVSVKPYERLAPVQNAPTDAAAIFVTDERHLVALGPGLRIRNSDTEVITDWTPSLADQAEDIDRGSGSRHVRGVPVAGGYLILSNDGATLMRFTGSPELPWRFDPVGTNCGLIGPQAVAAKDGVAVWMSNSEQFYIYDGQGLRALECGLLRDVFDNLNRTQAEKVVAGINGRFDEVWISYPDSRDGATENSRTVVYNLRTGRWLRHSFGRSAWMPQKVFEYPIGVTSAGLLVYHENGTSANGAALGALVETAPFDLGDGETLMEIQKVVVDIKNQTGDMTLTVKTRLEPRAAEVSYGPYTVTTTTQKVDVLALGRQTSVRFASSATSSEWRLGSVILDVIDTGDRD